MVAKLVRTLEEIDREIERTKDRRRDTYRMISYRKIKVEKLEEQIHQLTTGYGDSYDDLDDERRDLVDTYANRIGKYHIEIQTRRKWIEEYNRHLADLEEQRESVVEQIDYWRFNNLIYRELDEFDYELAIHKHGFIHGTKL